MSAMMLSALMLIWMQIYYASAYQFKYKSTRNRFFYGFSAAPKSWSLTRMNEMEIYKDLESETDGSIHLPSKRKMAWPFNNFDAPDVLDGTLAGDAGFDPLGIATDKESLFILREAEIKHARLAMLAALGWPISELYHYKIATFFSVPNEMAETDGRAPSVLNGGLDNWNIILFLGLFMAVGGVLEFELMRRRREVPEELQNFFDLWREDGWDMPGNYGFDPLDFGKKFCQDDQAKKDIMQTVEIFNGRMAMLATVGFVVQEYMTGLPVVRETPQFFIFPEM